MLIRQPDSSSNRRRGQGLTLRQPERKNFLRNYSVFACLRPSSLACHMGLLPITSRGESIGTLHPQ